MIGLPRKGLVTQSPSSRLLVRHSNLTLPDNGDTFQLFPINSPSITKIQGRPAGTVVMLQCEGTMSFVYGSDLKLQGWTTNGDVLQCVAGDILTAVAYADNKWRVFKTGILGFSIQDVVNGWWFSFNNTMSTFTTVTPYDDTIPQDSETTSLIAITLTPYRGGANAVISGEVILSPSVALYSTVGIFRDGTAGALSASPMFHTGAGYHTERNIQGVFALNAGSQTIRIRGGTSTGTITVNGNAGVRIFGGVSTASLVILEMF